MYPLPVNTYVYFTVAPYGIHKASFHYFCFENNFLSYESPFFYSPVLVESLSDTSTCTIPYGTDNYER